MTAAEQRQRADRLATALDAAGLGIVAHHQEGGRGSYRPADPVRVIGWLARGGYWLREASIEPALAIEPPGTEGL